MKPSSTASPGSHYVWADRFGIWTSVACVVHCLLAPLLLALPAVLSHWLPGEESAHRGLAVLVAILGAIALLAGFRNHRRVIVLLAMCGGLGCIGGAAWFGDRLPSHAAEIAVTFCGSMLMITAHRLNHTFCRTCECANDRRPLRSQAPLR